MIFLACQISAQERKLALSSDIETGITFYAPIRRIELGDQRAYSLKQEGRKIYIKAYYSEAPETVLKVTLADGKHLTFTLRIDEENAQEEIIINYSNKSSSFSVPPKIAKLARSSANTYVRKRVGKRKYLTMNGVMYDGQRKYVRFLAINIDPSEIVFWDEYNTNLLPYTTKTVNGHTYLFVSLSKKKKIKVAVNGKNFKF